MKAAVLACLIASIGHAQDPQPTTAEPVLTGIDYELAMALARVSANEASLFGIHPADVAMIWQITEGRGQTSAERLAWLRAMADCTLDPVAPEEQPRRAQPPRGSNCWWSWHLTDSDERPIGWDPALRWEGDGGGMERWRDVRRHSFRHVAGTSTVRPPCTPRPWTWGGPRWDQGNAAAHQLVQIVCVGTHNWGYITRRQALARQQLRARGRALLTYTDRTGNGSVPTQ
jgi:hypothetical protein